MYREDENFTLNARFLLNIETESKNSYNIYKIQSPFDIPCDLCALHKYVKFTLPVKHRPGQFSGLEQLAQTNLIG